MRHLLMTASAPALFAANKDAGAETQTAPEGAETTTAPEGGADSVSGAADTATTTATEGAGTDVTSTVSAEGIRARRAIMLKQFTTVEWIMQNVVAQGKGTKATLGRVFGICTGVEVKEGSLPNGAPSTSIVLVGDFQTEDYQTGELGQGVNFYAPAAYSEKIKAIYDANRVTDEAGRTIGSHVRSVEVDVDIGVEATGKPIPYEWVITAYREGEEMAVLKKLRNSRERPAFVLQTPKGDIKALPRPNVGPIPMLEAPTGDVIEGTATVA